MSPLGQIGPRVFHFGPFRIDLDQRLLFRGGNSIPLTPKVFDTLAVLVGRPGKVVEKAELLHLVWPDTFVEENNLTQNISALRKAFGGGEYIETIPRRGYRFLAPVEIVPAGAPIPRGRGFRPLIWRAVAIGALALVAIFAYRWVRTSRPAEYRVDSLVVLPFLNLTADPDVEYFSDGLTEELTHALAHLKDVRVVARTTAFQFKGKAQDIRSIAERLHVTTVLEGSVRRQANRFRVTVQLNDAASGYHIWSQTFDRDAGDIFQVQEDISRQVAQTIRPDSQAPGVAIGTRSPEAYRAYLMGRYLRNRPDGASRKRAVDYFQEAIRKDPRYAAAYAGLAECYTILAWDTRIMPPLEAGAEAQKAVDRAFALDADLAEAHTAQAIIDLQLARDWAGAEHHFRRAIAINGNDPAAHHWFSHYLVAMNRATESLAEGHRALELDPLDIQISAHMSWNYWKARDYPNAIKAGLDTLQLEPHSELAHMFLAWAYEGAGQWDAAMDAWQGAPMHPERAPLEAGFRADGVRGYWRARLEFLLRQKAPNEYQVAALHARLGESGKAMERLERAFQNHEPELIYVKRDAAFDAMAGDARFRALTAKLKLP